MKTLWHWSIRRTNKMLETPVLNSVQAEEILIENLPMKEQENNYPSQALISENLNFIIEQRAAASELLKAGLYTTSWDNPELWVKLILVVTFLMLFLAVMPLVLSPKKTNIEKSTAYECGFAPFFIKEGIIEIQFVVVALLFLIFDLEVVYLVPLALNVGVIGSHMLSIFIVYVHLAWLMLAVEGYTGALSWPTWGIYTRILRKIKLRRKKNKWVKFLKYPYFVKHIARSWMWRVEYEEDI